MNSKIIFLFISVIAFVGSALVKPRQLSVFSVVNFDNTECTSTDTRATSGICYSNEECQNNGGTAAGNCASGFGVCCIRTLAECGGTVSRNLTYFRNPGFPNAFTATTPDPCVVTFNYGTDICQIRLDFETKVLTEPTDGVCGTAIDKVTIATTPAGVPLPGEGGLCGDGLTGQHIYIETSRTGTASWSLDIGTTASNNRMWNIKTTYIECDSPSKAPNGCAQYHTGVSGQFQSYNFPGGQNLAGQTYQTCIRQEEGFCSIQYSAPGDNDFQLIATADTKSQNTGIITDCAKTAVLIPLNNVAKVVKGFCGGKFSDGSINEQSGTIPQLAPPFFVAYRTMLPALTAGKAGYKLSYTQRPC